MRKYQQIKLLAANIKVRATYLNALYFILLFGCIEDEQTKQETTIYGTWILTETYSEPPSGSGWNSVEDGYTYEIRTDNSFSSSLSYDNCSSGIISISEDQMTFLFECEEFSESFEYYFEIVESKLELSPLRCFEPCTRRFTKISEAQSGE